MNDNKNPREKPMDIRKEEDGSALVNKYWVWVGLDPSGIKCMPAPGYPTTNYEKPFLFFDADRLPPMTIIITHPKTLSTLFY